MIGGMIWPPAQAVASIPAAKVGETPRFWIIRIANVPVPPILATVTHESGSN